MHIFTITAVRLTGPKTPGRRAPRDTRCFGFYPKLQEAAKFLTGPNGGGIEECIYTHAIIEKFDHGVHALADTKTYWFRWNPKKKRWTRCAQPAFAQRSCNWAIG